MPRALPSDLVLLAGVVAAAADVVAAAAGFTTPKLSVFCFCFLPPCGVFNAAAAGLADVGADADADAFLAAVADAAAEAEATADADAGAAADATPACFTPFDRAFGVDVDRSMGRSAVENAAFCEEEDEEKAGYAPASCRLVT